jgi:hypothetical protein
MRPRISLLLALIGLTAGCGREMLLPRPDPLPALSGGSLTSLEQRRLADIRRFLSPRDQQVLEQTLRNLAQDPRLPAAEVDAAIKRALSLFGSAGSFCDRLAHELLPLALTGPRATAPARVAFAVPIGTAHEQWLSPAGTRLYRDPRALARAIRDGEFAAESLTQDTALAPPESALFVTDAAVFDEPGPSAARRMCLSGPTAPSYVLAVIPSASLPAPLRVPTAADAVCRPDFVLPSPEARSGFTCSGSPEFVTSPPTLRAVSELRLTR